ncbi:Fc.00g018120.m01.CDS01 [Cosmosporella sp. VM-42]
MTYLKGHELDSKYAHGARIMGRIVWVGRQIFDYRINLGRVMGRLAMSILVVRTRLTKYDAGSTALCTYDLLYTIGWGTVTILIGYMAYLGYTNSPDERHG